jgi:Pyruvate/2-oxoacid:ferredoxin oxidoreductase delta subunit
LEKTNSKIMPAAGIRVWQRYANSWLPIYNNVHEGTVGRNRRDFIMLDKNDILVDSYDNSSRQIPNINKKIDAKTSFKDAHLPLTEEQVKKETARCLGCGASVVDENKCIGCGICTTKCEFDAIHLFRDNPECSTMVNSDDKMKAILPYMIKRNFKIKKAQKAKKD